METQATRLSYFKKNSGFSLIEIMVVVVILGILASFVAPKIMSSPEKARMVKVKQDLLAIRNALDLYKLDNGFYPSTDQGLQALVQKPNSSPTPKNWKDDGYLRDVPKDPWSEDYQYLNDNERIRIFSYGPKGKEANQPIGDWNIDEAAK